MNVARTAPARPAHQPITRRALTITLWLVQLLLALQFAVGGVLKLSGDATMVTMFADIGAGQWLRYVVGALEIAGAVGLLLPRLAGLAALGLTGLLLGALATNVFILGADLWFPLVLLVMSAVVATARRSEVLALLRDVRRGRSE